MAGQGAAAARQLRRRVSPLHAIIPDRLGGQRTDIGQAVLPVQPKHARGGGLSATHTGNSRHGWWTKQRDSGALKERAPRLSSPVPAAPPCTRDRSVSSASTTPSLDGCAGWAGKLACLFQEPRRAVLQDLVSELTDWRLAAYLDSKRRVCKVIHSSGKPIIFLSKPRKDYPEGPTPVWVADVEHEASVAKIAVNVLRLPGTKENVLASVLRRWFGERAGAPGFIHEVRFDVIDGRSTLRPSDRDVRGTRR
jgi:hypothetical protein